MRRSVYYVLVLGWSISLIGLPAAGPALAVEEHHQKPQAGQDAPMAKQPGTSGPQQAPGMMMGKGMQGRAGKRMMGRGMMHGSCRRTMGGMMGGSDGDMMGGGMMRKMRHNMMRMMTSHMMGGPGGMAKMMGGMGSSGGKGMGRGMMARMAGMLDKMNLTPEQWSKVRKLATERLMKMVDLRAQQTKVKIQLSGLRWDMKADPKLVKELFAKKAAAQAEMFLIGLEYLGSLKGILTPEQAKKMETMQMQ